MRMSIDPRTIQTYDNAARQMADHFLQYKDGVAREEITRAFTLAGQPTDAVVEIGCGAGKDAAEIVTRASQYAGFDPSAKLLDIARRHVPSGVFTQADALTYAYPPNTDIVFAFASLLHLDKHDFQAVCRTVLAALRTGGIFCMTLKEADVYTEQLQEDEFGTRMFYLYPVKLVKELAGQGFTLAYENHTTAGPKAKKWMGLIFIKQ